MLPPLCVSGARIPPNNGMHPDPRGCPARADDTLGALEPADRGNSSGKLIETASVKPSGKVINKNTNRYDDKGRMIEGTGYDRDGQISDRRVYSYSNDDHVPSGFTYYGREAAVMLRVWLPLFSRRAMDFQKRTRLLPGYGGCQIC